MPYSPDVAPVTAIIGAGVVGGYHARALDELNCQIVFYEPDAARRRDMASQYGNAMLTDCLEEAIGAADVVHICSPPMDHMEGALASIKQGKPTIVEKPLTHNLDEAIVIYRAATAAQVPVMVGKHFRLTPPFLEIKGGIDAGAIGTMTSLETTYVHDMRKLQAGVGWRQELGPHGFVYEGAAHPVDLNMWLAGQPVRSVEATISGRKLDHNYGWSEDHVYALTYEDGMIGRVWSNSVSPQPQHGASVRVHGTTGAYEAHNKKAELRSFKDGDTDWNVTQTDPIGQTIRPMAALFHSYLSGESSDFTPMPSIGEALGVMVVLNSIEEAARTGRAQEVPSLEQVLSR